MWDKCPTFALLYPTNLTFLHRNFAVLWDKCLTFALLIPLIPPICTEFFSICGISQLILPHLSHISVNHHVKRAKYVGKMRQFKRTYPTQAITTNSHTLTIKLNWTLHLIAISFSTLPLHYISSHPHPPHAITFITKIFIT